MKAKEAGRRLPWAIVMLGLALAWAAPRPASADFHLWEFRELFTNADGTVQFIKMFNQFDGEHLTNGQTIRASQGAASNDFVFPSNTPTPTGGKFLLLATSAFASLPNAPTPDFTLPDNFLFRPDGAVQLIGGGFASYSDLPTDGLMSLHFPGGTVAQNAPINFAGQSGTISAGTRITGLPPIPQGDIVIQLQTIATGLVSPLGLTEPDDDSGRLFLWDQVGLARVVQNGQLLGTPLLDVTSRLVSLGIAGPGTFDERGLLGLACHPDFANNPRIYTYTSEPVDGAADFTNIDNAQNHQTVIAEWTLDGNDAASNIVDVSTRREILRIDQPQFNHNGGTVQFGPDGFLYISLGDGGGSNDRGTGHVNGGNAQDTDNIYGTLLRIDVNQSVGAPSANNQYTIPPDNPFVGMAGLDEIFVFGLRNPYLFSFDMGHFTPGDFRLYIGDAGQNDMEEVNRVTPSEAGGNYGWPFKEGSHYFDVDGSNTGFITTAPPQPVPSGLIDPLAEYARWDGTTVHNGTVVVGGFVHRDPAAPELEGRYLFGDFGTSFAQPSGRLWYLDENDDVLELLIGEEDEPLGLWVKGFGQDRAGAVYVLGSERIGITDNTGVALKIVPFAVPNRVGRWTEYP